MIITDQFIYVHVMKTGGTSIHNTFERRHGLKCFRELHASYLDVPEEQRAGKYVWGLMRDPVEQEASLWRYHAHFWGKDTGKPEMSFEDWCKWRYQKPQQWAETWLNQNHIDYGWGFGVRPQAGFFCDESGVCQASHIYRFDNLHSAMEDIQERFGFDMDLEEHKGMVYQWSRERRDYPDHITSYAIDLLKEAKAIDFGLWNTPGDIPLEFECETVPNYAYTR
jgi:hypothetical protein